ncbi:TonB-dependent hemoglobin/transferrin/lactoferrin family receptor [Denitratisoma sp. agr-D3]
MHVSTRRVRGVLPRHFITAKLSLAILFAFPHHGHGAEAGDTADTTLPKVSVSATRIEQDVDTISATVTTVTAAEIDQRMPLDETDLFANEPDLAVARNPNRFGSASVNIRGLEGNRVVNLVDGVRLPDYYGGGGPSNITVSDAGGPHFDFLKRVEVLRGTASSLYGSDALGGVVSYVTKDPEDFLVGGKTRAFQYKGSVHSADSSFSNTFSAAMGNDGLKFLLMVNRTDGKELKNKGTVGGTSTARTEPNPQDRQSEAALAKLVLSPAPGHRLAFVVDYRENKTNTEVNRLITSLPKMTWMEGDDEATRTRYGIDYEWKPGNAWLDRLKAQVFRQDAETKTKSDSLRANTSSACSTSSGSGYNCAMRQIFQMEQDRTGFNLQLDKSLDLGSVNHLLVAGTDWNRTEVNDYRDYTIAQTNIATGTTTILKTLAGTTYPSRGFAPGHTDTLGVFFQDNITFDQERFTLTPGLRYDRVELKHKSDAIFDSQTVKPAVDMTNSRVSPKLAGLWQVAPAFGIYGQYVEGFRAPNYEEVNGYFQNGTMYASIPNANLKPETSTSIEGGARWKQGPLQLSFSRYDNRYKNFIENKALTCPSDPSCASGVTSTYQSVNLARVHILGWEARGSWDFGDGYSLNGAYAFTRGDNEQTGKALNTVDPERLSLALNWLKNSHGGEARLRAAAAKEKDRIDGSLYPTGGYGVLDLSGWWKLSKDIKVTAALNNVFDREYILWSDVRFGSLAATTPGMAFYTQPGRNLSLGLQVDF